MSASGLFVTFEGGEGSGKSTQARLLAKRIEERGRRVLVLREPGGTEAGEELRRLLLYGGALAIETEVLLFLAARAQLVAEVIRPALNDGVGVICDRFSDSTIAYQGYGRGLDVSSLRSLNGWATGGLQPDLTVLLDVPVEIGRQRKEGDDDTFQRQDESFHRKVREGYLYLAASEPSRWLVVDGTKAPEEVSRAVWERAEALTSRIT